MKKWITLLLVFVVILSLVACGGKEATTSTQQPAEKQTPVETEEEPKSTSETETTQESKPQEIEAQPESGMIEYTLGDLIKVGDYEVAIYEVYAKEVIIPGTGKENFNTVIMKYRFINNGKETTSFGDSIRMMAFQDGVELGIVIPSGDEPNNMHTNIRPNVEIDNILYGYYEAKTENHIELELFPARNYGMNKVPNVLLKIEYPFESMTEQKNARTEDGSSPDISDPDNFLFTPKIIELPVVNAAGNNIGTRAYIESSKILLFDDLEDNEQLASYIHEFFEKEVEGKGYNWFNIYFEDGSTLLFVGANKLIIEYTETPDDDGGISSLEATTYMYKDGAYRKAE